MSSQPENLNLRKWTSEDLWFRWLGKNPSWSQRVESKAEIGDQRAMTQLLTYFNSPG